VGLLLTRSLEPHRTLPLFVCCSPVAIGAFAGKSSPYCGRPARPPRQRERQGVGRGAQAAADETFDERRARQIKNYDYFEKKRSTRSGTSGTAAPGLPLPVGFVGCTVVYFLIWAR